MIKSSNYLYSALIVILLGIGNDSAKLIKSEYVLLTSGLLWNLSISQIKPQKFNKNYIKHKILQSGGKLSFSMSNLPNKKRGISKESYPYSMTLEEKNLCYTIVS